MNRVNKSLLAAAVIAGLAGGVSFARAAALGNSQSAHQLDDGPWKHLFMHRAKESLRAARHELESAEDVFKGHREEALAHVDHALKEIQLGVDEDGGEAANPAELPSARQLDEERHPHMHRALEHLNDALAQLQKANKFNGHRDAAIAETQSAINQLDKAIHDAER